MLDDEDNYEPEYEPEDFVVADRYHARILAVVPPPLEYMMTLHSQEQEISGRQVWCGSLLLAHTLVFEHDRGDDPLANARILELGSGTGLVGMIVSKLDNNSKVVLTDGDEEAMGLLEKNLADPYNEIDPTRVKATFLRWNEKLEDFDSWCRKEVSDNNEDGHASDKVEFDVVLAGDVMYKKELPALFFRTADRYLSPKGVLWLCHIPRSTVTHQVVQDAAVEAGFRIETVDTSNVVVKDCPKVDLDRAVVYKITR